MSTARRRARSAWVVRAAARILRVYDSASAADLADGLAWYARAEETARVLAAGTDGRVSYRHAAGIIAALSPRVSWSVNVAGATAMVDYAGRGLGPPGFLPPMVAGTSANREKAWRIAGGADPETVLGGPKVRAFFANLTGDLDAVTVDRWAARVAEGCENTNAPHAARYSRIADAYRRAAGYHGIAPRDMQAATWVAIRRQLGAQWANNDSEVF